MAYDSCVLNNGKQACVRRLGRMCKKGDKKSGRFCEQHLNLHLCTLRCGMYSPQLHWQGKTIRSASSYLHQRTRPRPPTACALTCHRSAGLWCSDAVATRPSLCVAAFTAHMATHELSKHAHSLASFARRGLPVWKLRMVVLRNLLCCARRLRGSYVRSHARINDTIPRWSGGATA